MINASAFLSALIGWYERHGRDLPWRHTHDPYAIWLSEIILQQTRIAQGQAYWERFMQRFPTVQQLAEASEDEVLKLWQGLGYYSRARNLHAAARQIVAQGHFPNTLADIQRLKGVGPYTASAIAAFAFNRPAVAIDGNAYRVFARLMGIHTPINSSASSASWASASSASTTMPPPSPTRARRRGERPTRRSWTWEPPSAHRRRQHARSVLWRISVWPTTPTSPIRCP